MKNYITIAALLAAGTACMHAATTEEFTFTEPQSKVILQNEYDLSKDWTLTFDVIMDPSVGANQYGTALISSEENPLANWHGIQVYSSIYKTTDTSSKFIVKSCNNTDAYTASFAPGENGEYSSYWPTPYLVGETTFTLKYTATDKKLTFSAVDGYDSTIVSAEFIVGGYADRTLTFLTTGITAAQLEKTIRPYEGTVYEGTPYDITYDAWSLPSGTFTGTVVPEPSAFGLLAGIGALALVASRRRRK